MNMNVNVSVFRLFVLEKLVVSARNVCILRYLRLFS